MGAYAFALVLLFLAIGQLLAQAPVSATSPMNSPRYNYTGTLLNTGNVLVTGGNIALGVQTNSAELYDPRAGTWRYTASVMNSERSEHTATKLADGRVLIASGLYGNNSFYTNSADVFDPSTETFTATGNMTYPHSDNAAVLLNDGRVLVVGQTPNSPVPSAAEVWDPNTGQWSISNSNLGGRPGLAIARLIDGRVLVTGGGGNEVDLFDPVPNTWQQLNPLLQGRSTHTSTTLPNGKVLVSGGYDPATGNGNYTAEIYDVTANGGLGGSTLAPGSLTVGAVQSSAVLLSNGDVLLAGGYDRTSCGATTTTNAQLYHFASGTLSTETPMLSPRALFPMTLLPSGQVLSSGGVNVQCTFASVLNQAELWGLVTSMPLTALGPVSAWIGLANSDDAGIRFDLKAEVYRNSSELVGTGELDGVQGGSSGFNNAHQDIIPLVAQPNVWFSSGDSLSIKLLVRNACSGSSKNSGRARLWFNDSAATSRFQATIGTASTNFLVDSFGLASSAGSGPKRTIDVQAGSKCSPFTAFGTWTRTLP